MGNRACNGVLCYDVNPEMSVQDDSPTDIPVIYNSKNLPWRFKRALSNSSAAATDDSNIAPPSNKRRPISTRIPSGIANYNRRKNKDRQQHTTSCSDLSNGTNENEKHTANTNTTNNMQAGGGLFSSYYHCRTMSSETCGREARTEVNLSRRSSTTTCEREGMYDDILLHRSCSRSEQDERS